MEENHNFMAEPLDWRRFTTRIEEEESAFCGCLPSYKLQWVIKSNRLELITQVLCLPGNNAYYLHQQLVIISFIY